MLFTIVGGRLLCDRARRLLIDWLELSQSAVPSRRLIRSVALAAHAANHSHITMLFAPQHKSPQAQEAYWRVAG